MAPSRESTTEFLAYANSGLTGICALRLHPDSGTLRRTGLVSNIVNPSFMAIHQHRPFLFAVSQVSFFGGENSGSVSAFLIERSTGTLAPLNTVSSGGAHPCFISLDRTGNHLLVANYTGGSVAVLPIGEDGRLSPASASIRHRGCGVHPERQSGPFVHSIHVSPDNRFAIAADLGLDQLLVYQFDARNGSLTPHRPALFKVQSGAGPRHFTFHPNGRFAYVINELNSTLETLSWEPAEGVLSHIQTVSTLPAGLPPQGLAADVVVHPNGQFLYGSNRGHDTISIWSIDTSTGALTPIEHVAAGGASPWNLTFDPSGLYLVAANQRSGNLAVFRVEAANGLLTDTGRTLEIPSPVCVRFARLE